MPLRKLASLAGVILILCGMARAQDSKSTAKFTFGSPAPGTTQVSPDRLYSKQSGYGFDLGQKPKGVDGSAVTSDQPFYFSVVEPEGNYQVTVTLGDPKIESTTTVKAEGRRLMLESIHANAGQSVTRSFTVNIRYPQISTGGAVGLDTREIGVLDWDDKLTLEFSGDHPSVSAIEITPIKAITVYVIGDSTVTDQPSPPGGSWAQNLPRWFSPQVAIANHAESGETLKAFRRPAERRWDKVLSLLKPGDYVFMQFGTNDMKMRGNNNIYPDEDFSSTYAPANTEFKALLEQYAAETKQRGATPVIVSAIAGSGLRDGKSVNSRGEYPQAAKAAAAEAGCPFIDLNAMSIRVNEALGPDLIRRAYVDQTHNTEYGGYLLSRCIVEGIKQDKLPLAAYLVDDAGSFDPDHPTPLPNAFTLPADPPFGGGGGGRRTSPTTNRGR